MKRLLPETLRVKNEKLHVRLQQATERAPCYGHVKTLVYIDLDGVITPDADVEPWLTPAVARALATRGRSFVDGITDHLLTNYIRGLEGQDNKKPTAIRRRSRTE